jgi:hypothetical protein
MQKRMQGTFENRTLYLKALDTLHHLMFVLRLQKEWFTVTSIQYNLTLNADGTIRSVDGGVDSETCIKLLTRCLKMYEAK